MNVKKLKILIIKGALGMIQMANIYDGIIHHLPTWGWRFDGVPLTEPNGATTGVEYQAGRMGGRGVYSG